MQSTGIGDFQSIGLPRRLRTLRDQRMKYFTITPQATPDTLKKRYKALCNRYHPDKGGSNEIQALINVEYRYALNKLKQEASMKGDRQKVTLINTQMDGHLKEIYNHFYRNQQLYEYLFNEIKEPIFNLIVPHRYRGIVFDVINMIKKHYTN